MRLWTKNVEEVLQKLSQTIPQEGMTGEIHYWRDMFRILDALCKEVKQPFVEIALQILNERESADERIKPSVK